MDVRRLVKPNVRELRAYEAHEVSCRVKLDANESPYGMNLLDGVPSNRYPDPEAKLLKRALGKSMGVKPENILMGNGSDELIFYLTVTFGGPVLFPSPTFVMYGMIARALGEKPVAVKLGPEFDLDLEGMLRAIKKEKPKLIYIATPNNPSGNCMSADRILRIAEAARNSIVVVDEAYQPFSSDKGFAPLLQDYKNMVIMRTLSKIGLAALRVGYMAAHADIIDEVNKVRLPFNLNACSQSLALAALKDTRTMRDNVRRIVAEREILMAGLDGTEGVEPYPSEANFILFKVADPDRVHKDLLKKGVLIKNVNATVPGCLRAGIGTPKENKMFITALRATLRKG